MYLQSSHYCACRQFLVGDPVVGAETAEKPVIKLTYAQLRDRLPAEITDDVVQLLANSEEALQEFAYIETQNDVNAFNLKYGVNLIIPPAPQTA